MRNRLADDLRSAMKRRDRIAMTALRGALAAIDNAGAAPRVADQPNHAMSEHIAGGSVGLGAGEVQRREVSDAEVRDLLHAQIAEHMTAADELSRRGSPDGAALLRAEADVLRPYVTPSQPL